MIINDEVIQNAKAWAESRGYDVIKVEANDRYVLAVCKKLGRRIIMELPRSMFN